LLTLLECFDGNAAEMLFAENERKVALNQSVAEKGKLQRLSKFKV